MSELLVIQQMKKIEIRYKYHFRDEEKVSILLQCMHSPRIRNKLTDIFEELTNIADSTKNEKLKFYIETCIYFEKEKIKVFKDGKNGLYGYFAEETLSCCSTFDEVSQYIKEWEENKVYKIHKIFGIQKMTFFTGLRNCFPTKSYHIDNTIACMEMDTDENIYLIDTTDMDIYFEDSSTNLHLESKFNTIFLKTGIYKHVKTGRGYVLKVTNNSKYVDVYYLEIFNWKHICFDALDCLFLDEWDTQDEKYIEKLNEIRSR